MAQTQGLSEGDKSFIRDYVETGTTEEQKRILRKELAEHYQVPVAKIAAISAWTKIHSNRILGNINKGNVQNAGADPAPQPVTAVPNNKPVQSAPEQPVPATTSTTEGGDHFEYDNPVKNAWRKKLEDYVQKNTSPAERKNLRVLCLPGKKGLELDVYIRLGFSPQNIVGVEGGDEEARREFVANAARYGIQTRLGGLCDIAKREELPFDVVSLDFMGPLCKEYISIFRNIYLADRAVVMVNTMAKREASFARCHYKDAAIHLDGKYQERAKNLLREYGPDAQDIPDEIKKNFLREARNEGLMPIVGNCLGINRPENMLLSIDIPEACLYHPYDKNDEFESHNVRSLAYKKMVRLVVNYLGSFLVTGGYGRKRISNEILHKLPNLVQRARCKFPFVTNLKRYEYLSRGGSSPFISDFMAVETPRKMYKKTLETTQFIADIVQYSMHFIAGNKPEDIEGFDNGGFRFIHEDGSRDTNYKGRKDCVAYIGGRGQMVAQLPIRVLEDDLCAYDASRSGNLLDLLGRKYAGEKAIPDREKITG